VCGWFASNVNRLCSGRLSQVSQMSQDFHPILYFCSSESMRVEIHRTLRTDGGRFTEAVGRWCASQRADMQKIVARDGLLLTLGAVAAILLTLWAFGLLRSPRRRLLSFATAPNPNPLPKTANPVSCHKFLPLT
jgi:hypothetical protein